MIESITILARHPQFENRPIRYYLYLNGSYTESGMGSLTYLLLIYFLDISTLVSTHFRNSKLLLPIPNKLSGF